MARIHPTSSVDAAAELADDVEIGPYCSITGAVRIGAGTQLVGHVYLNGPLTIGEGNRLYPFVCLGFAPQDHKWPPDRPGAGLVIGDRNILRESVTMHRATNDDHPTRVSDDNMFMVNSHVGHDSVVGSHGVFANNSSMGGHSRIGDQVNFGGGAATGQYTHVGRLAFIAGNAGSRAHVPPFMVCRRLGTVGGVNIVGLRRNGMSRAEIDRVKWAWRVMFQEQRSKPSMIETIECRANESEALREIAAFLRECEGAICKPERACDESSD